MGKVTDLEQDKKEKTSSDPESVCSSWGIYILEGNSLKLDFLPDNKTVQSQLTHIFTLHCIQMKSKKKLTIWAQEKKQRQ